MQEIAADWPSRAGVRGFRFKFEIKRNARIILNMVQEPQHLLEHS